MKDIFPYSEKIIDFDRTNILISSMDKSETLNNIIQTLLKGSQFFLSNTKKNSLETAI